MFEIYAHGLHCLKSAGIQKMLHCSNMGRLLRSQVGSKLAPTGLVTALLMC